MTDENTILDTDAILKNIERIFKDKGPFCSEEEFRYYFLSKIREVLNDNNNYSLEYPFEYHKKHNDHIYKDNVEPEANVKNAKVDAILWGPENLKHGLYAFEFKYAHKDFIDKHDKHDKHERHINDQTPTINVRYNFLEDIDRLESLFDDNDIDVDVGYAIFLTDKEAYRAQARNGASYYNIRLSDEKPPRTFSSNTEYMCTWEPGQKKKKYHNPIVFRSDYTITWNQIGNTEFWCCIVEVKPKGK